MNHLCYLCLVFVILSRLFIAALWSPAGKVLTSWLLFVMFNCVFCHFLMCGIGSGLVSADLLALVCDVYLCFCHFSMWYPGSGLVLDCIDSRSLLPFLILYRNDFCFLWILSTCMCTLRRINHKLSKVSKGVKP